MSGYRFRLERVRQLRLRDRDLKRQAVAEAVGFEQRTLEQIARLDGARDLARQDLRKTVESGRVDIDAVLQSRVYAHRLEQQKLFFEQQLEQVRRIIAVRREALLDAERKVKALDKLDERLRERHRAESDRLERLFLDDVAGQRFLRDRSEA
jgi:flagellar export protein FliJ